MSSDPASGMLADIQREVAVTAPITGVEKLDPTVLEAMRRVPRETFVPPEMRPYAYEDRPLPIGHNQTISQPYIVALMTHLLRPRPAQRILEVGTGSDYQAAVLAELVDRAYSIDRVPALAQTAGAVLDELGCRNIEHAVGNGYTGWPEHAPYDGIIVTAAASHVPPALLEQLEPGARLVIPVGPPYGRQELLVIEKDPAGKLQTRDVLPVAFVPMQEEGPGDETEIQH